MTGFGLIHLGFLAATAAVAVPVLVHLLLKPRARQMDIGTLRFLKLALRDSTRRRKLRRWLLFALRVAAVLLLALLFARPYYSAAGNEGREREVVLLIDQSASMGVMHSDRSLFDRAQEVAEKILKQMPEGTAIHLAYGDALGVAKAPDIRVDRTHAPGFAGTDYGLVLGWARDVLVASKRARRTLYLFTDLQRAGLRGKPFDGMPPDIETEIIDVGKAVVSNLAVDGVETTEALIRPKESIVVTASVFNAGPMPARDVSVRLSLAGSEAKLADQVQKVTVAPGVRQAVHFSLPIQKPGLYRGFVEVVAEDDFPLDNRRWLAFEARAPDRVLLIDGEPGRTVYGNATYYLETALRLRLPRKGGSITPYEPERLTWASNASLPDLRPFRLVVLCNVAAVPEDDLARLQAFVAAGGGLLIFSGKNVQPAGYHPIERLGLLPASIEGTAGPDFFRFADWDKGHPILKPLSDPQQGDLRRLNFQRLTRLKLSAAAKVLATAQGGEPLLVEGKLERGTILLFASTADRDWSSWPQSRLYVPLIHQMVGYLSERLPENQRVREEPTGPGRENPPGINQAEGFTTFRNIDPSESDMERVSEQKFREACHLPDINTAVKKAAASGSKIPADNERPDELWVYVVWALLFVLVGELFVANRTHA
jgi:hypothetical protein